MTTPLDSEPMPGDGQVPHMSVLANRLFGRLPEVYRRLDARESQWPFKRYLGAVTSQAGTIDDTIERIAGDNPIGPALPEPIGLDTGDLALWRLARRTRPSALADPSQADVAWLPWLAQLVGARLDPSASEAEKRDTIRFATSGWRAGTRQAIADAARTALTGTKFAKVMPHTIPAVGGGVSAGDVWDVTVVTRSAETPDPNAVLGAILRKGAKPAGVVLHHAAYTSSWDLLEARFPTWNDIESVTWAQLEEAGISYQDVPGNLLANPSFEVDTAHWAAADANTTIGRVLGGIDGEAMLRVTATATGDASFVDDGTAVTPGAYTVSLSTRPDVAVDMSWTANYFTGVTPVSDESSAPQPMAADTWARLPAQLTVPGGADRVELTILIEGLDAGEFVDVDAVFLRRNP